MKRVYTSVHDADPVLGYLKVMLESQGIECVVTGEHAGELAGRLPARPLLWILDDARYDDAVEIIRSAAATADDNAAPWKCPGCEETIGGQFSECWKCGAIRCQTACPENADDPAGQAT